MRNWSRLEMATVEKADTIAQMIVLPLPKVEFGMDSALGSPLQPESLHDNAKRGAGSDDPAVKEKRKKSVSA